MDRTSRRGGVLLLLPLALLALAHAVFALDLAARVWDARAGFEAQRDAHLLILLEVARAAAIAVAGVGVLLLLRGVERYRLLLAVALTAAAVWYGASFTVAGFAGPMQGALAVWLRGVGVPDAVLAAVFGDGGWALWIGVAALLRGGVLLLTGSGRTPAEIRADDSGRPGLLRGAHLAGADVGAAYRKAAAAAIEKGWLAPRAVWSGAVVMIALHLALPASLRVATTILFLAAAGLAFTLLRTALRQGGGRERAMMQWAAAGAALGAAGYVAGASFALLAPGPGAMAPTFAITAATPVLVAACLVRAAKA